MSPLLERSQWTLVNQIIIAGKQVIYSYRLGKTIQLLLKYIERIEHLIAKRRNRLKFHHKKWELLISLTVP